MRRLLLILGSMLLAVGQIAQATSNSADAPHLHVQLVFPNNHLSEGASSQAGLYFKLEQVPCHVI